MQNLAKASGNPEQGGKQHGGPAPSPFARGGVVGPLQFLVLLDCSSGTAVSNAMTIVYPSEFPAHLTTYAQKFVGKRPAVGMWAATCARVCCLQELLTCRPYCYHVFGWQVEQSFKNDLLQQSPSRVSDCQHTLLSARHILSQALISNTPNSSGSPSDVSREGAGDNEQQQSHGETLGVPTDAELLDAMDPQAMYKEVQKHASTGAHSVLP